jgi:hypothetical protein
VCSSDLSLFPEDKWRWQGFGSTVLVWKAYDDDDSDDDEDDDSDDDDDDSDDGPTKDIVNLYYDQCVENWDFEDDGDKSWADDLSRMSAAERRATYEDQFPGDPPGRLTDEEVWLLTARLLAWAYDL